MKHVAKRALDVALASVLLAALWPLVALLALAIRLQDGGPAFFVQERVGHHGRRFRMVKLRSMVPGADRAGPGRVPKVHADPRVTPLGRVLRRTSLDELPQLVNVLRGEMSLVGPRPPLPVEVDRYTLAELRRLSVLPGMTGLWQVSGRADLPPERWMALDLEYVDRWSLWLDLTLLVRTVPAVVRGSGAR
jgi:lipopolysaccharide/colanic/teichoic acid biosynthesis glycosyltransferase